VTRGRELPGPMFGIRAMQEGLKVPLKEGLEVEKIFHPDRPLPGGEGQHKHILSQDHDGQTPAHDEARLQPGGGQESRCARLRNDGPGDRDRHREEHADPGPREGFPETHEPGKAFVRKILEGMAVKKKLPAPVDDLMGLIRPMSEYTPEFKEVDLVVEAVFEDIR